MKTRAHDAATTRQVTTSARSLLTYGVAWFVATGLATWALVAAGAAQ
jgi:hypothetical protein